MSNKPKSKTNITKITARSHRETPADKSQDDAAKPRTTVPEVAASQPTGKVENPVQKTTSAKKHDHKDKKTKNNNTEKPLKEVFLLARPFVALGRYLRDSWRELRQVRWPNRKATWKMTLAVLVYCAIFIAFITLLDTLFTFIFKVLLGN